MGIHRDKIICVSSFKLLQNFINIDQLFSRVLDNQAKGSVHMRPRRITGKSAPSCSRRVVVKI
jgi:hypothetical protein